MLALSIDLIQLWLRLAALRLLWWKT